MLIPGYWWKRMLSGSLALALLGCSRPAAVNVEGETRASPSPVASLSKEDPNPPPTNLPTKQPVVRGQAADEEKPTAPPSSSSALTPFEFPGDQGGALLRRLLAPGDLPPDAKLRKPRPRTMARQVESPRMPLPPQSAPLPRLSFYSPVKGFRPQLIAAETLFGEASFYLAWPEEQNLPTGPLLKVPSVDVHQPVALPPIARPLPGRESVNDPTRPAAAAAVLRGTMPQRTTPAPFIPQAIPDPFENRAPVQSLAPPSEENLPPTTTPLPVRK